MITCRLAFCAESIQVDRYSNGISITNVLEDLSLVGFPTAIARVASLFLLERTVEDPEAITASLSIEFVPADRQQENSKLRFPVEIDFQGKFRVRAIQSVQGLPVTGPGKLVFQLLWPDEVALGKWEIPLLKIEQPDSQGELILPVETA